MPGTPRSRFHQRLQSIADCYQLGLRDVGVGREVTSIADVAAADQANSDTSSFARHVVVFLSLALAPSRHMAMRSSTLAVARHIT